MVLFERIDAESEEAFVEWRGDTLVHNRGFAFRRRLDRHGSFGGAVLMRLMRDADFVVTVFRHGELKTRGGGIVRTGFGRRGVAIAALHILLEPVTGGPVPGEKGRFIIDDKSAE